MCTNCANAGILPRFNARDAFLRELQSKNGTDCADRLDRAAIRVRGPAHQVTGLVFAHYVLGDHTERHGLALRTGGQAFAAAKFTARALAASIRQVYGISSSPLA
ncbi:MAG: hypothetical protein AB1512_05255 [Thermodesulfobacteriota bacterium]